MNKKMEGLDQEAEVARKNQMEILEWKNTAKAKTNQPTNQTMDEREAALELQGVSSCRWRGTALLLPSVHPFGDLSERSPWPRLSEPRSRTGCSSVLLTPGWGWKDPEAPGPRPRRDAQPP